MSLIRFDQVSKRFTLHLERSRSFQQLFLSAIRRERRPKTEEFWALRDVSFVVERGEMVGLIGPNGAGKSTALKLVSRIIEPTSGSVEVKGRVGALLELGTGFHPDLTGRENIYLSGSFSGFGRPAIDRMVGDIIDFSEIERFIDVPVKHYSSGMFVRLGFAIAVQFEPDVLLVDEVLAVGDQAFQRRCLDRIQEMRRRGVSILLVSHEMRRVQEMCSRALWLDDGRVMAEGAVEHVIEEYETHLAVLDTAQTLLSEQRRLASDSSQIPGGSGSKAAQEPQEPGARTRWGSREAEITAVQILDGRGRERRTFRTGEPWTLRIHYLAHRRIEAPQFGLALYHSSGFHLSGPNTVFSEYPIPGIEGTGTVEYTIPHLPLLQGSYLVSAAIYDQSGNHAYDHIHQRFSFRVLPGGVREEFGSVHIPAEWSWSPASAATDGLTNPP